MNLFIEHPATASSLARRKPIFGIGINDASYMVCPRINDKAVWCQFYRSWVNMIERCYSEKYLQRNPTYIDCTVAQEWLLFTNFKSWMKSQDWKGKELDKDIMHIGNKVYSPDNCLLVSRQVNTLLNDSSARRGEFPIGVNFDKARKKFRAKCRHNGQCIHLGYYDSPEAAHIAYCKYKHMVIIEAANAPENYYIRQYLLQHAAKIMENL